MFHVYGVRCRQLRGMGVYFQRFHDLNPDDGCLSHFKATPDISFFFSTSRKSSWNLRHHSLTVWRDICEGVQTRSFLLPLTSVTVQLPH